MFTINLGEKIGIASNITHNYQHHQSPPNRTLPAITTIIQTPQSSIAAALLLAIVVMKLMQHRGNHIESELFATTGALYFTRQHET